MFYKQLKVQKIVQIFAVEFSMYRPASLTVYPNFDQTWCNQTHFYVRSARLGSQFCFTSYWPFSHTAILFCLISIGLIHSQCYRSTWSPFRHVGLFTVDGIRTHNLLIDNPCLTSRTTPLLANLKWLLGNGIILDSQTCWRWFYS